MLNMNTVQEEEEVFPISTYAQNHDALTDWKMLGGHLRHIFYQIRTFHQSKIRCLLLKCVCVCLFISHENQIHSIENFSRSRIYG